MSSPEVWTIQRLIQWTTYHFNSKKIPSARLDAELLLAHTLKIKRLDLYLKFDQPLGDQELAVFRELVKRRAQLEPLAYIVGEKEFYGKNFSVGPGVLIPRPETEILVDETLKYLKENLNEHHHYCRILDVGSGTGCIGLTLASQWPMAQVVCVERSADAQKYLSENVKRFDLGPRVQILSGDFETLEMDSDFDVVVSNPPYIGNDFDLMKDVKDYEPAEALFGGKQGEETLIRWFPKFVDCLKPKGLLACEIGFDQREKVLNLLNYISSLENIRIREDYAGHPRVVLAQKKG